MCKEKKISYLENSIYLLTLSLRLSSSYILFMLDLNKGL